MDILNVDLSNVSGGSLLIFAGLLTFALVIYKASPIGQDAVESWKSLAEGRKAELDDAREDAAERFAEVEALKAEKALLEISLARCQEQPKTEELARAINALEHTQNQILGHLEQMTAAVKSMEHALLNPPGKGHA